MVKRGVSDVWWNYGPPMWEFWFVFPIVGFIFMVVIMTIMFRFSRTNGWPCGFDKSRELERLRKEIQELRADLEALKKANKGG